MTQSSLESKEVFDSCYEYAEEMGWSWEVVGDLGYFTTADGFSYERAVQVRPGNGCIYVSVSIAAAVPHAFYRTGIFLHRATEGRLVLAEDDELLWCGSYGASTFHSPGATADLFSLMQREVLIAESLLQIYRSQWREISIPCILGLGFETEFDIEH